MKIEAKRTSIIINGYNEDNRVHSIENSLSTYEKITHTREYIGLNYNIEKEELRIPRTISLKMLNDKFECPIDIDEGYDEYDKAIIKLKLDPLNDKQKRAIAFLLAKGEFSKLSNFCRFLLELDTGVGKTYCTTAAIAYKKCKAAIILNTTDLIEQWKDRLKTYANYNDSNITIIKGKNTIDKLFDGEYDNTKIFLLSHATITAHATTYGWESVTELFERMRVGIKVFDEAHLVLANMIKIDLYTNTRYTYYLTATAKRSDRDENKIFKNVFYGVPSLTIKRTKKESYVTTMVLTYNSNPSLNDISKIKNMYGLDSARYMKYMVNKGSYYMERSICIIINSILNKMKDNNEYRIAILLRTIEAVKFMKALIMKNYPEFKKDIGNFTSDTKKDKDKQLTKKIILTTYKSFGTGMDIPDLRFLINYEAYSSTVILEQMIGRLRNIGGDLYYFEIVDFGFKSRFNQFTHIKNKLSRQSKEMKMFNFK